MVSFRSLIYHRNFTNRFKIFCKIFNIILILSIFIENVLVVIGGLGKGGLFAATELIYKVVQMKCNISSFPYDYLYSHSSTMIPSGILVCGGFSSAGKEKRWYQYEKMTSSWQSFASMITRSGVFCMIILNQGIWAIGGETRIEETGTRDSDYSSSLDYFDFTKGLWTKKTVPFFSFGHCLTKMSENKLILIGGYQNNQVYKKLE